MKRAGAITVLNLLLIYSGTANFVSAACEGSCLPLVHRYAPTASQSVQLDSDSGTFVTAGKHEPLVASECKRVGLANSETVEHSTRIGLIAPSPLIAVRSREARLHALAIGTLHVVLRV